MRSYRFALTAILAYATALHASGCSDDSGAESVRYPVPDWEVVAPETEGMDSSALEEAAAFAQRNLSNCALVTRRGAIVGEWYWNGWGPETRSNAFSVTKTFTSVLTGIAQERGLLQIDDRASDYIESWRGTDSETVTIRHLLTNSSGRYWDFQTDIAGLAGAEDQTAFALGLGQQRDPGSYWLYNNAAVQTLEPVLEAATGMEVGAFAQQALLGPLGSNAEYQRDDVGNALVNTALQASCRDLARLGYLYLRGGRWADGKQIVPEAYVAESTQPATQLVSSYGYLWWLNREGHWIPGPRSDERFEYDGRFWPELPESVFAALGLFDQVIVVLPEEEMVLTRMGGIAIDGADSFYGFTAQWTQRALDAVGE